jgi:hypothetical protein
VSPGLDAPSQARRCVDLVGRALEEGEGAFLLGEPSRKLRRRCDSSVERGAALRFERSVRERRQFSDVLTAVLVCRMTSRSHGTTNASSLTESLFTF